MTQKRPTNEPRRKRKGVNDPRLRQTYPAGNPHHEPDDTENKRSQKQPGQDLSNPQKGDDDGK